MKHPTTVDDSGAHSEVSGLLDVCGAPDTAAQTILAKLHEYLVRMSDLNRQGLFHMTSVGDVIVMSHARRWPLRCCASESEDVGARVLTWLVSSCEVGRVVLCDVVTQLNLKTRV